MSELLFECGGSIATVTFNRPHARNALTWGMYQALEDACDSVDQDDQIKVLIERDAVIGAAFDCWMIKPGWVIGVTQPGEVTMEHIVDHIDHICQIAGNARHAALGTDLDGGFGKEQSPADLETIADLGNIATILAARGYSEEDIEGILYKNWVEFFYRAWGDE